MTDQPPPRPEGQDETKASAALQQSDALLSAATELERLPPELRATFVSMMFSVIRNSTGPDPDTAKIVAETERHQESCKLEAYKGRLESSDKENVRDHEFRQKSLNHTTVLTVVTMSAYFLGVVAGLYLIMKGQTSVGTPILAASFTAFATGKYPGKKKDDD